MQINIDLDKIKTKIEENPVLAIGAAAALLTATSKLIDSGTQRKYAKIHSLEVNRRIRAK